MKKIIVIFLWSVLFCGLSSAAPPLDNHFVLGSSEDAEEPLFYPVQVEEGPQGNIYVLDQGDAYIKVFGEDGEFLKRLGGEGEGPGEFQRIDGANFGFSPSGELFFTEFINGHRWITIFDQEGDLKQVLSPKIEEIYGVQSAAALDQGKFLLQLAFNSTARPEKDYFLYDSPSSLVLLNNEGEIENELVNVSFTSLISYSPNGATSNLPFVPHLYWALVGPGEIVWTDGMSPNLQVIDLAGQKTREISTPLPKPQKVSGKDLDEWKSRRKAFMSERNPTWYNRYGRVIEEYSNPPYDKPIIGSLQSTPGGNLLVLGSAGPDSEAYLYWLLDSQGNELASVEVEAWGVHISPNYLFWFEEDQEGATELHVIQHHEDEKSALEAMAAGITSSK